jgi:hypothetical protein
MICSIAFSAGFALGSECSDRTTSEFLTMPEYHYPGDDGLLDEPLDWWTRLRLRAPWWPYVLAAVLFGCWYFWRYRSPTVAMVGWTAVEDFWLAALFFGLLAGLRGYQVLVRYCAEIECGVPHQFFRLRSWCMPWLFLIAAGIYFGIGEQWPMRVCFWCSRPALDHLANEALADPPNAQLLAGQWAGLYRIEGVRVLGASVVLYLDEDEGNYAFVRAPGATKDLIHHHGNHADDDDREYPEFPAASKSESDLLGKRLNDDWFVMYSWYRLVKVGWG